MEGAERLADEVVILDHGQVVAAGTPAALTGAGPQESWRFRGRPAGHSRRSNRPFPRNRRHRGRPGAYAVSGEVTPAVLAAVTAWCSEHGFLPEGCPSSDAASKTCSSISPVASCGRECHLIRAAPGAAPWLRMVRTQAAVELRALLRNGEQLLLVLIIPVGLLVLGSTVPLFDVGRGERVDFLLPASSALP